MPDRGRQEFPCVFQKLCTPAVQGGGTDPHGKAGGLGKDYDEDTCEGLCGRPQEHPERCLAEGS